MNNYLVVGIENRTSKKTGKGYRMLHLSQPFSDVKYGSGSKTSVEYVSGDNIPRNLKVGDPVQLFYGKGFDGKAYISGVQVIEEGVPTISVK